MFKNSIIFNFLSSIRFVRNNSNVAVKCKENWGDKMQAWQIHSYGGIEELKMYNVKIPALSSPNDVLIQVEAAGVNPIDVAITSGYGTKVINLMRKAKNCTGVNLNESYIEFPLTLGREFAGTVVSKGHGIGDKLNLGDEVWGVIPIEQPGCHANYVCVDSTLVNVRPQNISYLQAASTLYAGLTAWSALWITGGLCYKTSISAGMTRSVLVLGGSGGVGTLAIQLLKAWHMHVVTTCSSDAVNVLEKLGADVVIDYKGTDTDSHIIAGGPYDIILDCSNQSAEIIKSKGYPHSTYITLNSPLLRNFDEYGFIVGAMRNIGDLLKYNIPCPDNKSSVRWGYFFPSQSGINVLQELVEKGKLLPIVHEVYPFQELPRAYERVEQGHLRGKIVIDMK